MKCIRVAVSPTAFLVDVIPVKSPFPIVRSLVLTWTAGPSPGIQQKRGSDGPWEAHGGDGGESTKKEVPRFRL